MSPSEYIFPDFTKQTNFGLEYFILSYIESLIKCKAPLKDIICLLLFMLKDKEKEKLLAQLKDYTYLTDETEKDIFHELTPPNYHSPISAVVSILFKSEELTYTSEIFPQYVTEKITELKHKTRDAKKKSTILKQNFSNFFNITLKETSVVLFEIMIDYYEPLKELIENYNRHERTAAAARMLDLPEHRLKETIRSSILLDADFLNDLNLDFNRRFGNHHPYYLQDYLKHAVETGDFNYIKRTFFNKKKGRIFNLNSFPVNKNDIDILKKILSSGKGSNILIYGPPGTGKTEFVRSICKDINTEPEFLYSGENGSNEERKDALIKMSNIFKNSNIPLVIDDADALICEPKFLFFRREPFEKSWMNTLMENSTFPIIWIVNDESGIDEAAARRFLFTLRFEHTGISQRQKMIRQKLTGQKYSSIPREELNRIVSTYPVPISKLSDAINVSLSLSDNPSDTETIIPVVEKILQNYKTLTTGKEFSVNKNKTLYDSTVLNTDIEIKTVENALYEYLKLSQRIDNITFLFHGKPGTGKTALAKHLADINNLRLICKEASDLVSPWVGETEQKIAATFKEAEREKALLLIDEADSFLSSRSNSQRGYEKRFTNQFLSSLENYKGIVVCSTNLLENLDHAVLRRFNLKVGFKYLNSEGIKKLFRLYFPRTEESKILEEYLLIDHCLTPGDFAVVSKNLKYKSDNPKIKDVIELLEIEESYKKGKSAIGF